MSLSTFLLASSLSMLYTIAAIAVARLETRVSNLEGELLVLQGVVEFELDTRKQ